MIDKSIYRINGFTQLKAFLDLATNKYYLTPQHISLYLYLFVQCNNLGWPEWIYCSVEFGMHGSRIGNKDTYYRCLKDLDEKKIIVYKPGINRQVAAQVHLIELVNPGVRKRATDKDSTVDSTGPSAGNKNNLITDKFNNQLEYEKKCKQSEPRYTNATSQSRT